MHHKHDVSSKDVFSITDMAAGIFFWKFCTISKEAAKRYILSPQITFSSSSLFLLIRLRLPSPGWDGNLRLKRRKNEEKEKVKWGDKMCLFAYDAKFSTKNPSGHIYDIKGIFWAYIMFMVHIPFKFSIHLQFWGRPLRPWVKHRSPSWTGKACNLLLWYLNSPSLFVGHF